MNLLKMIGIGRSKVSYYKPVPKIPVPDEIVQEYKDGATLFDLYAKHHIPILKLRAKIESAGVTIRPKGKSFKQLNWKLTPEDVEWLLAEDDKNVPHMEIAKHLNVTRERVRQICIMSGHPTRRSRLTKTLECREASIAKRIDRDKRLEAISTMWKNGASLEELNQVFGCSKIKSVGAKIASYRMQYPDLFPLRMKSHGWHSMAHDEIVKFGQLWSSGVSAEEIAVQLGYKNAACVRSQVQKYRYKHPELFPVRNRVQIINGNSYGRMKRASEMWKSDSSAQEISQELGYLNYKSLNNAIFAWRKKWPELFPARKPGIRKNIWADKGAKPTLKKHTRGL